jgi:hypothetical protein
MTLQNVVYISKQKYGENILRYTLWMVAFSIFLSACAMGIGGDLIPNNSNFFVFDNEPDLFIVKRPRNDMRFGKGTPSEVPMSVIENSISTHCGVSRDFYFFNRICNATQKALREHGDGTIYLKYENQDLFITFLYDKGPNQFVITVGDWSKNAFAFDMKKVKLN